LGTPRPAINHRQQKIYEIGRSDVPLSIPQNKRTKIRPWYLRIGKW